MKEFENNKAGTWFPGGGNSGDSSFNEVDKR